MFIDANRITEKGIVLDDTIELDENLLVEEDSFFLDGIDYNILFSRVGDKIRAKGKIRTSVSLKCVKCLENYEFKINSRFDIILFPGSQLDFSSAALKSDEMEYIFYEGDSVNLNKILIEQVNLFIPYNPICCGDCKGICPNCGSNLNQSECKCDSSMSELSVLFNKIKR